MAPRVTAALIAAGLALGLPLLDSPPAAADSFFFGFSSGHYGHRHRHHQRHWQHHHWRPYHHYGYTYAPPPRVVYVPPPVVYTPPPLAAVPASPIYQGRNGQYCREYQATVTVNGVAQPSYGTACLQPDGAWRVVN